MSQLLTRMSAIRSASAAVTGGRFISKFSVVLLAAPAKRAAAV
jgi:hypothetical protein